MGTKSRIRFEPEAYPDWAGRLHFHYWDGLEEGLSPETDLIHQGKDVYNVMISEDFIYFYNRYQEVSDPYHMLPTLKDTGLKNFTIPRKDL